MAVRICDVQCGCDRVALLSTGTSTGWRSGQARVALSQLTERVCMHFSAIFRMLARGQEARMKQTGLGWSWRRGLRKIDRLPSRRYRTERALEARI